MVYWDGLIDGDRTGIKRQLVKDPRIKFLQKLPRGRMDGGSEDRRLHGPYPEKARTGISPSASFFFACYEEGTCVCVRV